MAVKNRTATSGKLDDVSALGNKQSKPVVNEKKEIEVELQGENIENEKCHNGSDVKQGESESANVCEEGKHKFWDEIRKQVECGENKEDHWQRTILWRAFQFNPVDQKIAKYLVDHGADIYSQNEEGETVLGIATRNGLLDLVKYFVQYGPKRTFRDDYRSLQSAIQSQSFEIVEYFVKRGANVNGNYTDGETVLHFAVIEVLHYAASNGTLEMVKYLVENGADVNGNDTDGWTVLHNAVTDGKLEIIKYLVENGADVNGKYIDGWTVLHYAVSKGTLEMVEYLVEKGAAVNGKNTYGRTVLHCAVTECTMDIVKYLVENGADVIGKATNGWTVLHYAVSKGTLEMVKYLVEKGADVDGKNTYSRTVLHYAVSEGTMDIVKYLVENGAGVIGKTTNGWTVLHNAVSKGTLEMVKYLVEKGADVNGKDTKGWTVLHNSVAEKRLEIIKCLVEIGADVNGKYTDGWTIFHYAVSKGTQEMVKYLVEEGAEINGKDTDGWTVLHAAVTDDKLEIIKYLVENGADVNGKSTSDGWTVLHYAVSKVKYLVENGADVIGKTTNGRTVLHSAVTKGTLSVVRYLVRNGANVNGKNSDKSTVLHSAVNKGSLDITKHLVENGADVNAKYTDGWTVLHAAVDTGELEIVKYLVEQGADIAPKSNISALGTDIMRMAVVNNSVALVKLLLQKNIVVSRAGKFLVEGRQMSLLEWSIYIGHDEIKTILKRSIKHREKIEMLKTMNHNQLEKTEIPIQAFVAKNQFKIGDGCGGSRVYVGLMKDGSEVAVKRILVQSEDKTVENEKEIMSLIETENCPFIVSYRYFHSGDDFMYLIVDLCEENLRELVHACSIEHLQEHGPRMIREILSGLEFLHGKGVLHRDLKPSNVLVDIEGRMKLADFGISRVLEDDQTTVQTFVRGTPGWMPSEVTQAIEKNEKCRFKRKSDVQVAGMIAFYVLTKGEHPFGSSFDRMRNISEGNSVSLKKLGDRKAQKFVSWLINHKIDERPYAHEALRDPFVDEH
ncbi:uncharacterized protein LOC114535293 [Dendronephthya gigantea]|uniref:uncharacterized protein LOC114535293 n=1 Tax=Dendronephthya gigantea TaxID=151771 RepID=UPI00106A6A25|nr:uncharacterized protein LOC114535293 [Dendronephthya gigantea]